MDNQVIRIINALCEDVGTPRALAINMLANAGEWAELQKFRCIPSCYSDSEAYWKDNLVTELLRKCDIPSAVDKEAEAVKSFFSCEAENCKTNARLSRYLEKNLFLEDPQEIAVAHFISEWRKEVMAVLGPLPLHITPRFSSGATFADTGKLITIPDKMSSTPTAYNGMTELLPFWEQTLWYRAHLINGRVICPDLVRGNIFFTVNKDALKKRGCGKEASIAVSLQLDVGRHMRKRLERIGIHLPSGKETHMMLAKQASIDGINATVDKSDASDLISRVVPELLLDFGWYELLNSLRAQFTRVNGKWVKLEKFSSMGNGFTFELETVIFATLARTLLRLKGCDPDSVSCYGDDLILPTEHLSDYLATAKFFGFKPNGKKTFGVGPFRESCGGDYYNGVPVRAHYLEELPDEPQKWIALANGLRRVALAHPSTDHRWSVVRRAWFRALDAVPSDIRRLRGPVHLGDLVIHDDDQSKWQYCAPPKVPKNQRHLQEPPCPQWEQKWITVWAPVYSVLPWKHWKPSVQLASCTLGLPSSGVTPRGGVSGYRRAAVPLIGSSWVPSIKT